MGSRHRTSQGLHSKERKDLCTISDGTEFIRRLDQRAISKRIYPTIKIATIFTVLLRTQKGKQCLTPMSRLLISKRIHKTKCVPIAAHIRSHDKSEGIKVFH